ncbi:50S ribosomal protein L5 [Candidatus Uhrbacteria bacterium]|nr:50S ribosomal protein L5 [Candidatus Uhrbacteria bacterium]
MTRLKELYTKTVKSALQKELALSNTHQVPSVSKVTVNVGLNAKSGKDSKIAEVVEQTLLRVTGQKPVKTLARQSIAGFKIREGMVVGMVVTLRGGRMWDFLDKLVEVTFPRVRDFRGIPLSCVDAHGNFSYGFREHTAFPEIKSDEIESLHGLQVTITTDAQTHDAGVKLLRALGFPFQRT